MQTIHRETVVVGAGIVGTSIAYELAKNDQDVLVIDQGFGAQGATAYSVGLRFPFGRSPEARRLAALSDQFYSKLPKELFVPLDAFAICNTATEAQFVECCDDRGSLRRQERSALYRQLGLLDPDLNGFSIISFGHSYHAIPQKVAEFMCLDASIQPSWGTRVTSIIDGEDNVRLGLSDGREIRARRAYVAAGPWVKELLAAAAVPSKAIRVKKIVAFHLKRGVFAPNSLIYFPDDDAFILNSRLFDSPILSITSDQWDVNPASETLDVSSHDLMLAKRILQRYFPRHELSIHSARVFCDSYSVDNVPSIIAGGKHVSFVCGMNGSGFRLAPGVASLALKTPLYQ